MAMMRVVSSTSEAVVMCMVAVAVAVVLASQIQKAEAAVSCGQVHAALRPCYDYVRNGRVLPPACCRGVRELNSRARTARDRRDACSCLKALASSLSRYIRQVYYSRLPARCGVNIPYNISPSIDCSRIR